MTSDDVITVKGQVRVSMETTLASHCCAVKHVVQSSITDDVSKTSSGHDVNLPLKPATTSSDISGGEPKSWQRRLSRIVTRLGERFGSFLGVQGGGRLGCNV